MARGESISGERNFRTFLGIERAEAAAMMVRPIADRNMASAPPRDTTITNTPPALGGLESARVPLCHAGFYIGGHREITQITRPLLAVSTSTSFEQG